LNSCWLTLTLPQGRKKSGVIFEAMREGTLSEDHVMPSHQLNRKPENKENIAILVLAFDKLKRDEILMPELSVYDTKWKSHPTLDDAIALNYDRCTGMAVAQPS